MIGGQVDGRVGRTLIARAPIPVLATPCPEHSRAEALPGPGAVQGVVAAAVRLPGVLGAAAAGSAGGDTAYGAELVHDAGIAVRPKARSHVAPIGREEERATLPSVAAGSARRYWDVVPVVARWRGSPGRAGRPVAPSPHPSRNRSRSSRCVKPAIASSTQPHRSNNRARCQWTVFVWIPRRAAAALREPVWQRARRTSNSRCVGLTSSRPGSGGDRRHASPPGCARADAADAGLQRVDVGALALRAVAGRDSRGVRLIITKRGAC